LPGSTTPILGTYGFFFPHKGFDALIEAVGLIRAEWPEIKLRMVTAEFPNDESPAEIARCRELARRLGLEDAVEWHTDYLSDEGSLALLSRCDLIVLAHRETQEAASGAVRVAMASGVPVLVTPAAIFDDLGDAVIRADGMSVTALAAAIAAALRDQKLRRETVDEADRWLREHDWARMSERLHGMICSLVANRDALVAASTTASLSEQSNNADYQRKPRTTVIAREALESHFVPASVMAEMKDVASGVNGSVSD
jgi:glycosyltransferase involved in cell wall biosynthesis